MGDISIGQKFHSLELAKQAINEYIVDRGWSYHTFKSDHKRCWVLICKKAEEHCCNFRIRVTVNKDHKPESPYVNPIPAHIRFTTHFVCPIPSKLLQATLETCR